MYHNVLYHFTYISFYIINTSTHSTTTICTECIYILTYKQITHASMHLIFHMAYLPINNKTSKPVTDKYKQHLHNYCASFSVILATPPKGSSFCFFLVCEGNFVKKEMARKTHFLVTLRKE